MVSLNPEIVPGITGEKQTTVDASNVAGHVDRFSTPSMISLMEQAATDAIAPYLAEGYISVGFEVHVRHLAPSDIGATIIAQAEVLEVSRNRVTFQVAAYDGDRKIGEGTHQRAVIARS